MNVTLGMQIEWNAMIDQIGVLWKCIAESFGPVEGSSPEKLTDV